MIKLGLMIMHPILKARSASVWAFGISCNIATLSLDIQAKLQFFITAFLYTFTFLNVSPLSSVKSI